MNTRSQTLRPWLILAALILTGRMAIAAGGEPVAVVYSLEGEASLAARGAAPHPLRLLDRLTAGERLGVGPGSRLALAFLNGRRFELGAGSRVKIGREGLATRGGVVRALPPVPRLLVLSPITAKDRPAWRQRAMTMGASVILGEKIEGLYPHRGATTLAEETFLGFHPTAGATKYHIEIMDAWGWPVFSTDTDSPWVKVPAGALRSGTAYRWTVRTLTPLKVDGDPRTLDQARNEACGDAELVTVRRGSADAREETRRLLALEGPSSQPLLAEIDRSLGLLLDAHWELRVALDSKPGDSALLQALAEVEVQLNHDDESEEELPGCVNGRIIHQDAAP